MFRGNYNKFLKHALENKSNCSKVCPHFKIRINFFYNSNYKNFSLYIPNKELVFINHTKHGRVYPVYIADEEYNKKDNPKKVMPLLLLFTGLNVFFFLSGFQIIPMTKIYSIIYSKESIIMSSAFLNYYLLRKYLIYLSNYASRVKSMYLLPSGDRIILENFDDSVKKLEILDIFESNLLNKFQDIRTKRIRWSALFVTNENNIKCKIKWGSYVENSFEGKIKFMDYEIFCRIIARVNIETKIRKFSKQEDLKIYSIEDKKKVLKYFQKRYLIKNINRNRLSYHYQLLRKRYINKKNLKVIKEEFKLF